MSDPDGLPTAPLGAAPASPAARRAHRAALARRLVSCAPEACAALDWDALGRAPDWLALTESERDGLQSRIGALLYARAVRLWIDGPRLDAARTVLGDTFLETLLTQPDEQSIPTALADVPPIATAAHVAPTWQTVGASVLLASLAPGPLRQAAKALLGPVAPSAMAHEFAVSLVARAVAQDGRAAPSRGAA
ncbi:MAG: hypothetical protein ABIX12_06395 [Rubrivivax sp.]